MKFKKYKMYQKYNNTVEILHNFLMVFFSPNSKIK